MPYIEIVFDGRPGREAPRLIDGQDELARIDAGELGRKTIPMSRLFAGSDGRGEHPHLLTLREL